MYIVLTQVKCWMWDVCLCIGKTWSARIIQWINNPKEWCNNHWGRAEVIITSFVRVVYLLPSNACLSCLDNGSCCWNAIYLEYRNIVGVLPVSRCLTKIKHSNISQNIKVLLTCHCLNKETTWGLDLCDDQPHVSEGEEKTMAEKASDNTSWLYT